MNLGTSLHWVSKKMGDKICLIENGKHISYSNLWKNIELLAKGLLKIGIKKNDKIIILLPNCKEFIYSFYALSRINAIGIPLDQLLTPYELKKIFDACNPQGIITTSYLYNRISQVFNKDRLIIFIDTRIESKRRNYNFDELFKIGSIGAVPDFNTSNNQIATINYTYRTAP
jgi:acyl-CoA synthetase (AMP-forming)/AMP-acid ligase II